MAGCSAGDMFFNMEHDVRFLRVWYGRNKQSYGTIIFLKTNEAYILENSSHVCLGLGLTRSAGGSYTGSRARSP